MGPAVAMNFIIKNSPINGKGLYATELIKEGQTVVVWNPKVLTKQEADKLPPEEFKHYTYSDGDKIFWMQPPERFMNHSCEPNTHVVNRSDIAISDIAAGQEITSDYLDLETGDAVCTCGSANCRGKR